MSNLAGQVRNTRGVGGGLVIGGLMDRKSFERAQRKDDAWHRNQQLIRDREKAAELGADHDDNQRVPVITAEQRQPRLAGFDPITREPVYKSGAGRYTMDMTDPRRERKLAQAPSAKPLQIVVHETDTQLVDGSVIPAGTLEQEFHEVHLKQIAAGDRCQKCWDKQPEDGGEHRRRVRMLQDIPHMPYELPVGLSVYDVCAYCGCQLQSRAPGGR